MDLLVKILNLVNKEYNKIVSLTENTESDKKKELVKNLIDEMNLLVQDYAKVIKNFVVIIYKTLKVKLDPLTNYFISNSNIKDNYCVELEEAFLSLINEMNEIVCVSSITSENIVNTIYYSTVSMLSGIYEQIKEKNESIKVCFINTFKNLVTNTNISEKVKLDLISSIEKLRITIF